MKESFLDVAGLRLRLVESSGTERPVLLCHGNSASADSFRPLLSSELGQRHRLIAWDLPGHGGSQRASAPPETYAPPALANVLVALTEKLSLSKFALLGHSLGGHLISGALHRLSGACGALLVSAPPLRLDLLATLYRPDPTQGAMFSPLLSDEQVVAFADALLLPGVVDGATRALVERGIRSTDPQFRPVLIQSIMSGKLADERAALETTSVPTALVYGSEDAFVDVGYFDSVRLGAPFRDGLFRFEGSGHSPHLDATDEFVRLAGAFLSEGATF